MVFLAERYLEMLHVKSQKVNNESVCLNSIIKQQAILSASISTIKQPKSTVIRFFPCKNILMCENSRKLFSQI